MKTSLYTQSYTTVFPTTDIYRKILFLFFLLSVSIIAFSNTKGGTPTTSQLVFSNAVLQSGTAGTDGAVYRFYRVDKNIDVLVKITGRSDKMVRLMNIDWTGTGLDKAFQPQVTYNDNTTPNGHSDWWMEFEISFVDKDGIGPASVTGFEVQALNIDGNNDKIREYVAFYQPQTYALASNSLLGVTTLEHFIPGKKFEGPAVSFARIDTSETAVMVTAGYHNLNSFRVRTGGVSAGRSASSDRIYSLFFKSFSYYAPVEFKLPLVMNYFNATLNKNGVELKWETGIEKTLSHFIVQRSTDGRQYSDAGIIRATADNGPKVVYAFSETVSSNSDAVLYYRLRMVDNENRYQHSAIRILKTGGAELDIKMQVFPNPVVNEVRVTIPANWQNSAVSYEVFNSNGQLVKRITSSHAGQTETVPLQDLGAGMYVVKAFTQTESAMQRIVKR